MSEPDDKPLAPALRAALLSEGLDGGPSQEQRARMADKLAAAVGVSAAALLPNAGGGGGGGSGGASATALAAKKPIAALLGALAVGGAVGVAVSELRPRSHEQPMFRDAAVQAIDAPAPVDANEPLDAGPMIDALSVPRDAGRAHAGVVPDASTPVASDDLARERQLIDVARAALRGGDLRLATKSLVEHSMRYPKGALTEEQRVLSIELAIAKGDSADAAQRAAAFRRDYPSSVFRTRVDELVPP